MSQGQKKGKLDKKTLSKTLKGALLAATGAAALAALKFFQKSPIVMNEPILVILVPALLNMLNEWRKGE